MPRNPVAYLIEMQEARQFLIETANTVTFDEYCQNKTLRLAVERCFITIGEAVNQLHRHHPFIGSAFRERPGIVAFRNVIVHEYWSVDDEDIWSTILSKVPPLRAEIDRILQTLAEQ